MWRSGKEIHNPCKGRLTIMKNITVKEYTELKDSSIYDATLQFLNASSACGDKTMDIGKMPYSNVKYCMRLLPKVAQWNEVQQLFEICFDVNQNEFWQMSIKDFFQAKNYIIQEFERVIETERKLLVSQSTDEYMWEMAGAKRLQPHNDTLPLIQLGKLFGQYPFDLGRKPYNEVFSLLVQVKVQNEVESEYQKLTTK